MYNIAAETRAFPAEVPPLTTVMGVTNGVNDFGRVGYGGPCPPTGTPHRYIFALDAETSLEQGRTKDDVRTAIWGHVLAEGRLTGTHGRDAR